MYCCVCGWQPPRSVDLRRAHVRIREGYRMQTPWNDCAETLLRPWRNDEDDDGEPTIETLRLSICEECATAAAAAKGAAMTPPVEARLRWTPRPLPILYEDTAPLCNTECPWFVSAYTGGCTHEYAQHDDSVCHPMAVMIDLYATGLRRARDRWRDIARKARSDAGRERAAGVRAVHDAWLRQDDDARTIASLRTAATAALDAEMARRESAEALIARDGNAMDYVDARDEHFARYGKDGGE